MTLGWDRAKDLGEGSPNLRMKKEDLIATAPMDFFTYLIFHVCKALVREVDRP